jgi:hypothetical protein
MNGPYQTGREVRELPAVRATCQAARASRRRSAVSEGNHRMPGEAPTAADAGLGGYGHRIVIWSAGWQPHTCAVVAGLITGARAAGQGGDGR